METIIYKKRILLYILGSCIGLLGCKKIIEVDLPTDKYPATKVYSDKSTAISAMTGIYVKLSRKFEGSFVGEAGPSIICGFLADELVDPGRREYQNNINGKDGPIGFWNVPYQTILIRVNGIIEGLSLSNKIPEESKQILLGEAKFIRAMTYFHLVNFFGDVPLVLTTDYKTNSNIARSPKSDVYKLIISDLKESENLLKDNYLGSDLIANTNERVRPNKMAAAALLARVYLYLEEWQLAEQQANKVISNPNYQLVGLNEVFLKNSKEAIWQLQPSESYPGDGTNTPDQQLFINAFGFPPRFTLSQYLLNEFEPNDLRRSQWTKVLNIFGSNFPIPFKYKVGAGNASQPQTEYNMVIRLAEIYLIRAEARAQQGQIEGENSAASDLNAIRKRAGLPDISVSAKNEMLSAIAHERYVELFTEMGHRWFDLKRTGEIDNRMNVVTPAKSGVWSSFKALLPIPYEEFKYNPSLVGHQNPGYSERP